MYLLFFFIGLLFYDLSDLLTAYPIPVPSFLFYTPLTHMVFIDIQILATPLLFLLFYFATKKNNVLTLIIGYYIMFVLFFFSHAVFFLFILSLIGLGMFITVIPSFTSVLSKVFWGISSLYLIVMMVSPYYSLFIIPSVIASGAEIMKLVK
ncbi:hypothetical protein HS7_04270 [Sulfolobales archaeon HS-7]|nr:hypothetical protein HS7_04270 [Sulfolobales archaeon HS-7]